MQALRSKYFLVGQNLNTTAQSTTVTRPTQPIAQPVNQRQPKAMHTSNNQNQENDQLSKASYKVSTSSQYSHMMDNASKSSVSLRQPTPGLRKSGHLFDEKFKASKSSLSSNLDPESYNARPALPPLSETDKNTRQPFGGSVAKGNKSSEKHTHSELARNGSKFPLFGQKPLWQNETTVGQPPLENRRTTYNLVAGRQQHQSTFSAAGDAGESKPHRTWGRAKKESVADIEEMLADMRFSGVGSRKAHEG